MDLKHLSPKTREMVERPAKERLAYFQRDSWIPYPAATRILDGLEALLEHPKCDRMPGMAISANTNNGKTRLMRYFLSKHESDANPEGGAIHVPVLYVQCPGIPDEHRLYDTILTRLFKKFRPNASAREKLPMVLGLLNDVGTRILAVDEANYAEAGTAKRQTAFLNMLRFIGNELQISIVTLGTEEMLRVIRTVPAFENRAKPEFLPRWQCDKEFRQLLVSFEQLLPFKEPSELYDKKFATLLHSRCEGSIGELKELLIMMAKVAMAAGKDRMSEEMVDQCGYQSASVRRMRKVAI